LNPRYERWRWTTFGITWLIYAGFYLTRQAFAAAKVAFEKDPRITMHRDQYGLVDSAYLTVYMFGQFIFGPLGDRFGPRRVLMLGMALSIVAAAASGFSTTFWAFLAFASLQGVAQSTGWTNTNKAMASWFSLRERGRVLGWWCTNYAFGTFAALLIAGAMMTAFGTPKHPNWQAAFWGAAAILGGLMVLAWIFLRDRPEDIGLPPIEEYRGERESLLEDEQPSEPAPEGSWTVIAEVLTTSTIWMLAIAYFSVKLVRYVFIFWGPKYAEESLSTGPWVSLMTAAVFPIGGLVGVVGAGYISDKLFQSRRAPWTIISLLALAGLMLLGLKPIHSTWVMACFFFMSGVLLFGPDALISSTAAIDFGTKRGAGTAVGVINGVGSIGGILGGYLPSKITTGSNWTPLFAVFLVALLASALLLLPLWRRKPPQR
jgi:OPA family sugar phosphate sensor protein UhpC-like MFS transporter